MTIQNSRRKFIRNISVMGLSLNISPPFSMSQLPSGEAPVTLSNDYFSVVFNNRTGRFNLLRNNGTLLLNQATARVNIPGRKRALSDPGYSHLVETRKVDDMIGTGKALTIHSKDAERRIDFLTQCSLYDRHNIFIISVECRNVSKQKINVRGIEPVCAINETGASMNWPQVSKILTNGPMYYDAGQVCNPDEDFNEPDPYGPIKGGVLSPEFIYPDKKRIRSWWNAALFSGYDREGLVCGFIENTSGLGQLILSRNNDDTLSLYTESVFAPGTELNPGSSISSGRFIMNIAGDPYSALEKYSDIMGIIGKARTKSILNGWCSWFYTYEHVTEDEVLRNAEFISRHLKEYGLNYVQVDEGYQRYHGDWEGNEKFPHGMKWLADKIKEYGLKPGLWLAPFVVSEPAEVFSKHPEWLLKHPDGSMMRVGPWPSEDTDWARDENPKRYGLDISHPGAQKWLHDLFSTAANDWGYEMFKIDFVAWSLLSAHHYYDNSYTPAMAYRKGMEIIRNAIGPEKHINDCGPGPVTVGLIDSMRIEIDQNYGFAEAAWKQYFTDSSSSAPAAAKRYYFHNKTWINDADHICIGLLSIRQARAAASLIALTGGNVISGDRLSNLDNSKLEILKKIYPAFGEAARPVDLFDTDRHRKFSLHISKPFGEWTIAGIFNTDKDKIFSEKIQFSRLGLESSKTYVVYDFWQERLLGEMTGTLESDIMPESVALLSIHERKNIPQFISCDRHVMQGAIEIDDIRWEGSTRTLSGTCSGKPGMAYNLVIYLPEKVSWRQDSQFLFRDYGDFSVKQVGQQLLKVYLEFGEKEKITWKISFGTESE